MHQLDADVVHIWVAALEDFYPNLTKLKSVLNEDEKARAARFRYPEHANDFVITRGILRQLLADYINVPAADIHFEYSKEGKPGLAVTCGGNNVEFNLSHSGHLALFGITRSSQIGVDIERIDRVVDIPLLSRRILSDSEQRHIAGVSDDQRNEAFYKYWTHKEAYLKATGEGIGANFAAISVDWSGVGTSPRLVDGRDKNSASWSLQTLIPKQGYVGAAVVNASAPRFRLMHASVDLLKD